MERVVVTEMGTVTGVRNAAIMVAVVPVAVVARVGTSGRGIGMRVTEHGARDSSLQIQDSRELLAFF